MMSKPKRKKPPARRDKIHPKPPENKEKRPRGRPSVFTRALGNKVCQMLVEMRSMTRVCQEDGLPSLITVYTWDVKGRADKADGKLTPHAEFSESLARAKEWQADALMEEVVDIADDGTNDWMKRESERGSYVVLNHEHVSRSKLRVDTRLAIASRLNPKKYAPMQKHADSEGKNLPAAPPAFNVFIDSNPDVGETPAG